ncbi:MAG: hypothetical protein WA667_05405 [Candidatus Nitrosopolaris sp.]
MPIGTAITSIIKERGFETAIVGIEVEVSDAEEISERVKEEIRKANGVIAILSPRIMDSYKSTEDIEVGS